MADHVEIFRRFINSPAPSLEEAVEAFTPLTVGDYEDVHIAALLATIRTRGETFADIAGAARAFLAAGRPFPVTGEGIMDTAGTGGDGANTINITTAASLTAAAGGVKMIKCGNRSVSSKSGSADVLEALNIPLDLDPDRAVRQFESSNFTFLFAPAYNPAIAFVQPVRKKLGVSTLFNTMGPLLSPARPEFQIMGIANPGLGPTIAETMKTLVRSRALVVHGAGTDEIAVHGDTLVWELKDGEISHYTVAPAELGVDKHTLEDLRGGDGEMPPFFERGRQRRARLVDGGANLLHKHHIRRGFIEPGQHARVVFVADFGGGADAVDVDRRNCETHV